MGVMRRLMVLAAVLLASVACDPTNGVQSEWVELAPMSVARSEHPGVVLGERVVVLGGFVETGLGRTGVTPTVEAYDATADSWERLPDLPAPRHHGMAAVAGDRLFVIGGYSEEGFTPVDTVWELAGDDWEDRARLPQPVGAGAAVVLDGRIYVVGGVPDGGLLRYDPAADSWTQLSAPDVFREHVAAVALDGELWAIGGRGPEGIYASTEIYDPDADRWRGGPGMGEPRSGFGAVVIDGTVYVAGGEVFSPNRALDSVERLPSGEQGWEAAGTLPVGLHGNPLVVVGSRIYLPGGSTEPAGVENAGDMYVLDTG